MVSIVLWEIELFEEILVHTCVSKYPELFPPVLLSGSSIPHQLFYLLHFCDTTPKLSQLISLLKSQVGNYLQDLGGMNHSSSTHTLAKFWSPQLYSNVLITPVYFLQGIEFIEVRNGGGSKNGHQVMYDQMYLVVDAVCIHVELESSHSYKQKWGVRAWSCK